MLNKVLLIGYVGADPEVRYTKSGTAVANFSLATNEKWKDKDGQKQERTEWHRIVVWDKPAEVVGEYVGKGSKLYAEGKNQTRKWQDKDGNDRWSTEVVAHSVTFLDSKKDGGGGGRPHEPPPMDHDDVPF